MNAILAAENSKLKRMSQCVHLKESGNEIVLIVLDQPKSAVNVLNSKTLHELESAIDECSKRKNLRGVIFYSAKPSVFIAGADLKEILKAQNKVELIELGQRVFGKLQNLSCTTVVAIHGACAGGGYELSLACDYRVASKSKETRIGLPEVQLGLVPAWGGSSRLPRLIGLLRAMPIILKGNLIPSGKALRMGMVDAIVPKEYLLKFAEKYVDRGKRKFHHFSLQKIASPLIDYLARRKVMDKTRGNYPSALKAVEIMTRGFRENLPTSLRRERDAILELEKTGVCRNLIQVFFLQEESKHLKTPKSLPVTNAAVIGAGVMGSGIAQWIASKSIHTVLRDVAPQQLAIGLKYISKLYNEGVGRKLFSRTEAQTGMDHIFPTDKEVPLHSVDIVIEAIAEKLELKKKVFAELERTTSSAAVLATNTSALSITKIADDLIFPERVIGLHFFNPVHRMKLVEIVRGKATSEQTMDTAVRFIQRMGKFPLIVADSPGFLVNRILMPYLLEAGLLFERGARVEDLDRAMLDFGMPMGPMRLLDEVGVDIATDVAETLCRAFPERMSIPDFFKSMLAMGAKGRKSGRGFYCYQKDDINKNPEIIRLQNPDGAALLNQGQLRQRMALLMVNEAAKCLEEKVVSHAHDADFGMIMGTGFAPFRGGPLRYADHLGLERVVGSLQLLSETEHIRFKPCDLLYAMSQKHLTFYNNENH